MKAKSAKSRSTLIQRRKSGRSHQKSIGNGVAKKRSALALKKILVPIDFSKHSLKAAQYAARFAEQFGATIQLLYVLEKPSYLRGEDGLALTIPEKELMNRAQCKLFSIAADEIEELVPVSAHVSSGKPFEEIVKVAANEQVDLIIIATHGYTGLKHVLMGSTAERVVRHAPCPVLVVRETEHEFA